MYYLIFIGKTMKKLYAFLLTILLTQTTFAQVTFFNKSSQRPIEVTYKFCYEGSSCEPVTLIIPNNNYLTVQTPALPENGTYAWIEIASAVAKDNAGNVIAEGKYIGQYGGCEHTLRADYGSATLLNIGVELDDQNLSPFILCKTSSY
jgi:hypothetical protein